MTNELLLELWKANQGKLNTIVNKVTPENFNNRLSANTATVGFNLQHIGEAQVSLAQVVFGTEMKATRHTIAVADTGQVFSLETIKELVAQSGELVSKAIMEMHVHDWTKEVDHPRFGKFSYIKGLGMIMNHTAHHLGQIESAIIKGREHSV